MYRYPNDCSLRGAIIASNADPNTADTINLPAGIYGRSTPYPTIVGSVDIIGAGAATTVIDANAMGRVLLFSAGSFDKIGLVSDVTLTGGNIPNGQGAGALVDTYGTVTLRRVTVRNNVAGDSCAGLFLNGNDFMVVENSTITGNSALIEGGGICNNGGFSGTSGRMTLTNVTISGNSAQAGGGVRNAGFATFTNVTLANNSATGQGGNLIDYLNPITFKNTIVANGVPDNCAFFFGGGVDGIRRPQRGQRQYLSLHRYQ